LTDYASTQSTISYNSSIGKQLRSKSRKKTISSSSSIPVTKVHSSTDKRNGGGILRSARLSKYKGSLLPALRRSKYVNDPALKHVNMSDGIDSLVQSGFVPSYVDMNFALKSSKGSKYLRFFSAKMNDFEEKAASVPYPFLAKYYQATVRYAKSSSSLKNISELKSPKKIFGRLSSGGCSSYDQRMNIESNDCIPNSPLGSDINFNGMQKTLWHEPNHRPFQIDPCKNDDLSLKLEKGYVFPIQDGTVLTYTPVYQSFRKQFEENGKILAFDWFIKKLEAFLTDFSVSFCEGDCAIIKKLIMSPVIWPLNRETLLSCLADSDNVR
jgi:hypothetical protein